MSTPFYDLASLVVVPSGYKSGKVYAQKPLTTDGQLAFTRASTATRVNASGLIEAVASGVPRLDYLGSTCPRLLLEPQRTNVIGFSDGLVVAQAFNGTLTKNNITSPDGYVNASLFTPTPNANAGITTTTITTSAISYTFSIYLKGSVAGQKVRFFGDLQNVTEFTLTTSFARYTATFTGAVGAQSFYIGVGSYISPVQNNPFYLYGCQLEAGAYATSYIPTLGASVTRVKDTYQKGGFGNTSTAGTLYYELDNYQPSIPANGLYMIQLFAGSSVGGADFSDSNGISIINNIAIEGRNNGYATTLFSFSPTAGATIKIALRYDGTNVVAFVNGVKGTVFADTSVGVKNAIRVNNGENGMQATKQLLFFPTALSDTQCIELTA